MKEKLKKLILIITGVIIRIIVVPFSSDKFDFITRLYPVSESLINGGLLYKSTPWNDSPIFALICAIMNGVSPFQSPIINNLFLSLPLILADIGIALAMYYFAKKIFEMSDNKSLFISALYFLNPRIISEVLLGHFDNISTLFIIGSVLLLFKSKDEQSQNSRLYLQLISGFILSIACLTRMYVILFIPLMVLITLKMENIRNAVIFLASSLGVVIIGVLPFIIMYPKDFFTSIGSNELISGYNQSSIWNIFSQYLPTFGIDFVSNTALNIISYVITGIICSFVICILLFKKEELSKKKIIQIIGIFTIGFAAFYSASLIQYYVLFIPFLIPVIFARNKKYTKGERFHKIMILEFVLLASLSFADLGFVVSSMEKVFLVNPGTDNYLGVISVCVYFLACAVIYWLENLEYIESDEIMKITQFVVVGLSGTLITWGTLFAFVEGVGLPVWISYSLAYSFGIVNNFIWNRIWTFRSEGRKTRAEFFKYIAVNIVSLSGYWGLSTLLNHIGLHYFVANIIGMALSFIINYILNRIWTFNYKIYDEATPPSNKFGPCSIIIPMHNEEKKAKTTILKVLEFLKQNYKEFEIIIPEDGAYDRTPEICAELTAQNPVITHIHKDEKQGRGRSLNNAIRKAKYDIIMYMDADLAVELDALPIAIGMVYAGVPLVYGDRYHPQSKTTRPLIREITSQVYNLYIRLLFRDKVADHQCGFKAFHRPDIEPFLDKILDLGWFWDSEIIIRLKLAGLKPEPIAVKWTEHRELKDSKVSIWRDMQSMGSAAIRLKKALRKEKNDEGLI